MDKKVLKQLLELAEVSGFDIVPRKAPYVELYPYQENTMKALDLCRHVMVKSARQMGKSTLIVERIRKYLNGFDDKTILIISPNTGMKGNMVDMVRRMVNSEYCKIDINNRNSIQVTNKFGAEINIFFWRDNDHMDIYIRGMTINVLIADEMAFMKYHNFVRFWEAYWPIHCSNDTTETLFISTSYGIDPDTTSFFEELWVRNNNFAKIIWNIWERPDFNIEFLNDQKKYLGPESMKREYMVV